ncbi:ABC transporter permease [Sinomonas terrae]|uniref:ABC transporter permease n=1 Tax=Sinomonas terrae TaxID=2908838 RepID=A0ABS9U0B0_9MICC|nr:ABC transporter permease [Sinomonas terrae]MCH6470063.1 ABC transporter permease [Sinomonas terrae]
MKLLNRALPPWTWSFAFAAVVFVLTVFLAGRGGGSTLSFAFALAPYLVLVGIGQMLVISAGAGNIDLSVGQVLSLAGFTAISATDSAGSWLIGLLAGVATGLGIAVISVIAITLVRMPPLVATLASGLIATAFTQTLGNNFQGGPSPALHGFLNWAPGGVPVFALCLVAFSVLVVLVLHRTTYGRSLLAVGQSRRAAEYAGVRSWQTVAVAYLTSGALAGLAGALLSSYIAPTIDLGNDYLLDSIAVVVIGGTLISGGRAVPTGVWGGALFFILLDGLLNLLGWSLAGQDVLKGLLLLAVLFLAGGVGLKRTGRPKAAPATDPAADTASAGLGERSVGL